MPKKTLMFDAVDKDFCILPCGKQNIGNLAKRKLVAKLHKPKCEICNKIVSFKDLYEVIPDVVELKKQTVEGYLKGEYITPKNLEILNEK